VQTISRESARLAGLSRFFSGEPCKHGHVAERFVINGRCHACHRLRKITLRAEDPEKFRARGRQIYNQHAQRFRAYGRKYYAKNTETCRKYRREHYRQNAAEANAASAAWKAANPSRVKAYAIAWRRNNLDKMLATNAARRAGLRRAAPRWVNKKEVEKFYRLQRRLTHETGVQHHVDHIIPLRGKTVCGLHVPWNLRVIPAAENLAKKNRLVDV